MAWFKPARNRKHPGDPAPRWTPLGRAGSLILLLAVIITIVLALMIATTRTVGASDRADWTETASGSSASPWLEGRLAIPERVFAVTLPEGWIGVDSC